MIIVAVEDEPAKLEKLVTLLTENKRVSRAIGFSNPQEALEWLENNQPDVIFIDIEMSSMNGILMAEKIRSKHKDILVVFLANSSRYAIQAYGVHATGYLLKPVDAQGIENELSYMESSLIFSLLSRRRLVVQTFGSFEVYYRGAPLKFRRSITKEVFAYLVDRQGASVTMGELELIVLDYGISAASGKSLVRTAIAELRKILNEIGQDDVIIKERNNIRIRPHLLDCDYYNYLKGKDSAVNMFMGEYMTNYSWAEYTTAVLTRIEQENKNMVSDNVADALH